jgi:hypothetical protein
MADKTDAEAAFVEAFDSPELATEVAASLACSEVDALAGLLRQLDANTAADGWIAAHALGDDEGDAHYRSGIR